MKSLANGVRAKTARTCDNCLKKRAHWFCAADEAFLCQSCDTSVHSANLLARRHERVRLKDTSPQQEAPTWHHGITRKPRTPRGSGKRNNSSTFHDMVPEITAEGQTDSSEVEGPLICQVPVLDPMVVEPKIKFPTMRSGIDGHEDEDKDESCLNEIFPTNMEVEDFAADVETLLGHGSKLDVVSKLSNVETVCVQRDNGRKSRKKRRGGGRLPSSVVGDGGREARVSRYREKKKTRSFTKTIRYEVRKLNAENKPRMKGRFVKRASLAASAGNSPLGVNN
ncbi:hypothetical protein F2Q69_00008003 [Brassica cretica]|uniref:B box-type domain-containing protein n=1 Tax=Brassica cretica TaxID=69181 RepID=A0A8S9P6S4_BRACR|nr:hypothetical protein F2Q69_00008003 [Brassica cretica]